MATELRPLSDLLREGPLPVTRAAVVAAQLAAILRERAAAGAPPHRQIDARKVLLGWDGGQPLVRLLEPDGTAEPRYLAPEQWAGLEVDARADVYATGALLAHMVQGVPPPAANEGRREPPRLAGVPEPLGAIARRALAPDPAARYAHAHDLFQALSAAHLQLVQQGLG